MEEHPPTSEPPEPTCPWCDYTAPLLKKVLRHMESRHYRQWCDLAPSPLIAGKRY